MRIWNRVEQIKTKSVHRGQSCKGGQRGKKAMDREIEFTTRMWTCSYFKLN
jgi:hypothetical protein